MNAPFGRHNVNHLEILRKTKYIPHRVKVNEKYVVKQFVKVYDLPEGEYFFEEVQGKSVIKDQEIDSGAYALTDGQQDAVFEQTAAHTFRQLASVPGALTAADVASSSSFAGGTPSKDNRKSVKREKDAAVEDDDSDEELLSCL